VKTIEEIMAARRYISGPGRQQLALAVSVEHDWDLPASGHDKLMAALDSMSFEDLEAAHLLAYHLQEAIACQLIRHDMARDRARKEEQ
jgi:hypothetical protein